MPFVYPLQSLVLIILAELFPFLVNVYLLYADVVCRNLWRNKFFEKKSQKKLLS